MQAVIILIQRCVLQYYVHTVAQQDMTPLLYRLYIHLGRKRQQIQKEIQFFNTPKNVSFPALAIKSISVNGEWIFHSNRQKHIQNVTIGCSKWNFAQLYTNGLHFSSHKTVSNSHNIEFRIGLKTD